MQRQRNYKPEQGEEADDRKKRKARKMRRQHIHPGHQPDEASKKPNRQGDDDEGNTPVGA